MLEALSDQDRVLLLTHNNPDPDAIATGWAIATIIEEKLKLPVRFVAGGAIVRAENKRMVELLKPPLKLVDRVMVVEAEALIYVDCEPTAVNHLLSDGHHQPFGVIDHHRHIGRRYRVKHRDIRPNVAASATIATHYLKEEDVKTPPALATALLYAIHTDALGWPAFTRTDHRAVSWLSQRADLKLLLDIQTAPLDLAYYADLMLALENTFLYGNTAICFLPRANNAEIVGEVADLLIRCVGMDRVLCAAAIDRAVLLSVRATNKGGDASRIVKDLLAGLGHGGGHVHRAGGKIQSSGKNDRIGEDLQNELRSRWLSICRTNQQRGTRLVARREILNNL